MRLRSSSAAALVAAIIAVSAGSAASAAASPAASLPSSAMVQTAVAPMATVLNRIVNVYQCSYITRKCRFWYSYQSNPPWNSSVGYYVVNEYRWGWWWI